MELQTTSNERDVVYLTFDEMESLLVRLAKNKTVLSVAYAKENECSIKATLDYDTLCSELSGKEIPKSPRNITIKIKQE